MSTDRRVALAAALVVLGFMVVNVGVRIAFPRDGVIHTPWLAPVLEAALVVLLVTGVTEASASSHELLESRSGGNTLATIEIGVDRDRQPAVAWTTGAAQV